MPNKPRQIRVMRSTAAKRVPWAKPLDAPKRLSGRQLQARNARVQQAASYTCANDQCAVRTVHGHVDHKTPLALGGTEDDSNLQYLCAPCNQAKGIAESRGIVLTSPSSFSRDVVRRLRRGDGA